MFALAKTQLKLSVLHTSWDSLTFKVHTISLDLNLNELFMSGILCA